MQLVQEKYSPMEIETLVQARVFVIGPLSRRSCHVLIRLGLPN